MNRVKIVGIATCMSAWAVLGCDAIAFYGLPANNKAPTLSDSSSGSSSGSDLEAQRRVQSAQSAAISPITWQFRNTAKTHPTEMQPLMPGRQPQSASEAASANRRGPLWITCIVGTTISVIAGAIALQTYRNREWRL